MDKIIKIGDIFFANLCGISCWGIEKQLSNGKEHIEFSYSNEDFTNEDDILVAVKYIGNGIVEEMVTGQKIIVTGFGFHGDYNDGFGYTRTHYEDNKTARFASCCIIDAPDETTIIAYINHIYKYKKMFDEYPLTLEDCDWAYHIDDDLKKKYLKHSDDERKKIIKKLKKNAKCNISKINAIIDEELQKFALTEELIDMALLENKIYDFENKGKSKTIGTQTN